MATYAYLRREAGNRGPELSADDVFGELTEHLLDHGDLNWALDKLLREGLKDPKSGQRIKGISQILKDIENKLRDYFRTYDIDPARDELGEMLREMIRKAMEEAQRSGGGESRTGGSGTEAQQRRWSGLSQSPSDFIEQAADEDAFRTSSPDASQWLKENQERIRQFESFYEDYSYRFRGRKPLTLEQALNVVEEIQRLEEMERNLRKGNLERVDPQAVDQVAGGETMEGLNALKQIKKLLEEGGYLAEDGYFVKLTPMAIRRIAQKALQDIFQGVHPWQFGRHPNEARGWGFEQQEDLKPYEFGDPFLLNVGETIRKSLLSGEFTKGRISPRDYMVHTQERTSRFSTALLIDMSWSMAWGGKFTAAKKVALALEHLIRTRFPTDRLHIVGFFTYAVQLKPKDLPFANLNHVEPFTNMQDALRLASRLLERDGNVDRQIIMITDGQPTAYIREDGMHIEWPYMGLSPNAFHYTIEEVRRITRKGVVLNVFMIDENPALRSFVEEMIKINRGRGLFTRPDQIGRYIIVDYIRQRSRLIH